VLIGGLRLKHCPCLSPSSVKQQPFLNDHSWRPIAE
jgi:hypothetical protein